VVNCHKLRVNDGRERGRSGAGAAGAAAARDRAGQGKERGGRRRGADRWGPDVSDHGKKEKKRGRRGPLRGRSKWAGGPLGRKVRR
jgi:hypothetical protein